MSLNPDDVVLDKASIENKVVASMNEKFGNDLSNLSSLGDLHTSLMSQLRALDSRLDLASTSTPTQLQKALASREGLEQKVDQLSEEQDKQMVAAREVVEEIRNFKIDNAELLGDIACVRGVVEYTVWLQLAEELATKLDKWIAEGGVEQPEHAVSTFLQLREARDALASSECANLRTYLGELVQYYYNLLHDRLMSSLDVGLASLGWPFIQLESGRQVKEVSSATMSTKELGVLAGCLLRLQEKKQEEEQQNTLVMKALLKPLRKRFLFHFLGSKSTNNPAKPEWWTTQLVLWATSHRDFLHLHIQPVYDEHQLVLPATQEFAAGLVAMSAEKLRVDLPLVQPDDILLAHTIDETIVLAREMAAQLQYSSSQISVLMPLTEAPWQRWLNMERKFAFEKLDSVLAGGEAAWQLEPGEGQVSRAADSFLAILLSVTERYKYLAVSQHRLDFLELQLQLVEDFRLRLVQLMRSEQEDPLHSNFCPILCTVDHLTGVLGTWAETPFFLQLEQQRVEEEGGHEIQGTVFDKTIAQLDYLKNEMVSNIVEWVMFSIRNKSREYRTEVKWFSIPKAEPEAQPAACLLLQALAFHLETSHSCLPSSVFTSLWQRLAEKMGDFFLEELLLPNRFIHQVQCPNSPPPPTPRFNQAGAKQLDNDIRRGLLPIFGAFTPRPQAHMSLLLVRGTGLHKKHVLFDQPQPHFHIFSTKKKEKKYLP